MQLGYADNIILNWKIPLQNNVYGNLPAFMNIYKTRNNAHHKFHTSYLCGVESDLIFGGSSFCSYAFSNVSVVSIYYLCKKK